VRIYDIQHQASSIQYRLGSYSPSYGLKSIWQKEISRINYTMRLARIALVTLLIIAVAMRSGSEGYLFASSYIYLTTKEEKELGKKLMIYVKKHLVLIEDHIIINYVNRIGQHIVAQLPSPPFDFHFYVVKENVYNAFAAPAGHVFINSGLLAAMDSEE